MEKNMLPIRLVSCLVPVLLCAASGCAKSPYAALATAVPCSPAAVVEPDCNVATPKDVTICVVFDAQGCIEKNGNDPRVLPYQAHACAQQDDLVWTAVRRDPGARNAYKTSADEFQVLFLPLGRTFGNTVRGETPARVHAKNVYSRAEPEAVYKYTIVGGAQTCNTRMFDPRIRIDPR